MSAFPPGDSEPVSKVLQVRHAANALGVSERTVYRRLRSGKLEQLPVMKQTADIVMSAVSEERVIEVIQDRITSQINRLMCQGDMTNDNLSALRQEMAKKDAQIYTLLETQQELTRTIQKLQAQIFELARLALIQPAKVDEKPAEAPLANLPPPVQPRRGLLDLLRNLWSGGTRR